MVWLFMTIGIALLASAMWIASRDDWSPVIVLCSIGMFCMFLSGLTLKVESNENDAARLVKLEADVAASEQYAEYQQLVEDAEHWREFSDTLDIISERVYDESIGDASE